MLSIVARCLILVRRRPKTRFLLFCGVSSQSGCFYFAIKSALQGAVLTLYREYSVETGTYKYKHKIHYGVASESPSFQNEERHCRIILFSFAYDVRKRRTMSECTKTTTYDGLFGVSVRFSVFQMRLYFLLTSA